MSYSTQCSLVSPPTAEDEHKLIGSAKNLALRLLEAWRNLRLSTHQVQHALSTRVQIRLKPP
jgi:hypothetical protein